MQTVKVGNVVIGEGRPKVIVPLVGKTEEEILQGAKQAKELACDFIEWRIDHFKDVTQKGAVAKLSKQVKEAVQKPVLITFRSYREGGELEMSDEDYFALYHDIIANGEFDLLDVELYMPEKPADEVIDAAHAKGIKIILCNHDFDQTPEREEIVNRLKQMAKRGADICKIALMPNSTEDVLTVLEATNEAHKAIDRPLITMSMGALGMVSRVSGEVFGSSATFGSAGQASAPGQVPVETLQGILNALKLND